LFAVASKKAYEKELSDLGLTLSKDQVAVGIMDSSNAGKYRMPGDFSADSVASFVKNFVEGKLKSYIKSEAVPADNSGPVAIVVGDNFKDIVLDDTKDVLIEFYAPWCGHCKKLEPAYNELGADMQKKYEGVTIAKMDATANDATHPKYTANGYPTIMLAPAGDKSNPIKYEGERDLKSFTSWLKKNAKKMKEKKTDL